MVRRREPCITASQVWMESWLFLTGMVPSPLSILVRSWPRAFLFGLLSERLYASRPRVSSRSCGEKILASPHGAVLM